MKEPDCLSKPKQLWIDSVKRVHWPDAEVGRARSAIYKTNPPPVPQFLEMDEFVKYYKSKPFSEFNAPGNRT